MFRVILKRFFLFSLFILFFFLFYIYIDIQSSPVPERKSYWVIEHKINAPSFEAYKWCKWQWKNFADMGLWTQECFIKWKLLSLSWAIDGNSLFYTIGQKKDILALQIFDEFDDSYSEENILDAIYIKLLRSGFLKLESLCNFEMYSENDTKLYKLFSKNKNSDCWDYWANTQKNTFFIIKKYTNGKRVFFINQMQKKLFDVQSLHIYE